MKNKKKLNINFFKALSIFTSVLFLYLFFILLLDSDTFVKDLGLQSNYAVIFIGRRASVFMLGISILMFGSRNLPPTKTRQIVSIAVGITMLGLAVMGSYELFNATVNSSILVAIVIETVLGVFFSFDAFVNRKTVADS